MSILARSQFEIKSNFDTIYFEAGPFEALLCTKWLLVAKFSVCQRLNFRLLAAKFSAN
jgi:hypothetical protein